MDFSCLGANHIEECLDLPFGKGFFVVKFDIVDERNTILSNNFSWDGKFPLMAKIWHKDFNPLTETFSKIPLLCLLNLPLHIWLEPFLEEVGNVLGDFVKADSAASSLY